MIKKLLVPTLAVAAFTQINAQHVATITVDTKQQKARIPSTFHGIFFEEISHAGEGGLYAELIQNRGFEESNIPAGTTLVNGELIPRKGPGYTTPNHAISDWRMEWPYTNNKWPGWKTETTGNAKIDLSLTTEKPLNDATPHSLQVNIKSIDSKGNADLVNEGFWGINAIKGDKYNLTFYGKSDAAFKGAVTVKLIGKDGKTLAQYGFASVKGNTWKKFNCTLIPSETDPYAKFAISFGSTGTVWLDYVSLFPEKTFKNRKNGMRLDLAEKIAGLKPAFVRWPGGCYVEGITIESAPNWKESIGPVEKRKASFSPWGYWSTNGFGYHEFLQFCEDIDAAGLYVFNVGVACEYRSGTFVPDDSVQFYVQNALDAIEYALGPVTSKWGKLRAANGHPAPFPLKYVEIGNEQHGPDYALRYNTFYKAIKEKYPTLQTMASMGIGDVNQHTLAKMEKVDFADEHAYKPAFWSFTNQDHFDKYKRGNWDMYVGEYATNAGVGRGNMIAALTDAAYIISMERNADLVKMSSYAPLLVNVNDVDWPVNLINFDAGKSFGRIAYYAIKMFAENTPNINVNTVTKSELAAGAAPQFPGGIGLATWDTQTEYKDIEVIENGQTVYKSDFINKPNEWEQVRGKWSAADSGMAMTHNGAQTFIKLKDKSFTSYTLKLKARKTGGTNAFVIPFAVKDNNNFMRLHIGSYVNRNVVIESVSGDGYSISDMTRQKPLKAPIETAKWYDISIVVTADKADCYLNGELLVSYTEPNKFVSIAGVDEKTGDIIVKVVNAYATPVKTTLQFDEEVSANALLTTLSSESGTVENSFAEPEKYIPVESNISNMGKNYETTFAPFSISIIRVKKK
jgi:alpha-N-arabinofuranosidase